MSRLIRRDDFFLFIEKSRQIGVRRLLRKVLRRDQAKTVDSWSHLQSDRSNWWDLEEVTSVCNHLITGSEDVSYQEYVAGKFFRRKKGLRAISVGCGTGRKEIRWAETKKFSSIVGYDISRPRIEEAGAMARTSRWNSVLKFEVGNVFKLELLPSSFDVVIFDNSLHHCSPLHSVLERTERWLADGGLVIVNEYVGPDRFQWTEEQVTLTNALLQLLPAELRRTREGRVKERMTRPGAIAMRLNDPSEAAESSSILDLLKNRFQLLEIRPYGGTILANLLKDIAHNFSTKKRETKSWLNFLFDVEDKLLQEKRIPSDYVFGVYRKKIKRDLISQG